MIATVKTYRKTWSHTEGPVEVLITAKVTESEEGDEWNIAPCNSHDVVIEQVEVVTPGIASIDITDRYSKKALQYVYEDWVDPDDLTDSDLID